MPRLRNRRVASPLYLHHYFIHMYINEEILHAHFTFMHKCTLHACYTQSQKSIHKVLVNDIDMNFDTYNRVKCTGFSSMVTLPQREHNLFQWPFTSSHLPMISRWPHNFLNDGLFISSLVLIISFIFSYHHLCLWYLFICITCMSQAFIKPPSVVWVRTDPAKWGIMGEHTQTQLRKCKNTKIQKHRLCFVL